MFILLLLFFLYLMLTGFYGEDHCILWLLCSNGVGHHWSGLQLQHASSIPCLCHHLFCGQPLCHGPQVSLITL